jgi:hypothetical protein
MSGGEQMIPTNIRWCIDGRGMEGGCSCCQHAYTVKSWGTTVECFGFAEQRESESFIIDDNIRNYVYEEGCGRFKEQVTTQKEPVVRNVNKDQPTWDYPEELKEYLRECGKNV